MRLGGLCRIRGLIDLGCKALGMHQAVWGREEKGLVGHGKSIGVAPLFCTLDNLIGAALCACNIT